MNAPEFLAAAEMLPFEDLEHLVGPGGIVVVAPHPDDESLGCGGLIAAACAADMAVRLVVVSDGVGSHPMSKLYPPSRLRALRQTETVAAVACLGLEATHVRFLDLPDAAVPTTGSAADAAVDNIVAIATACAASAILVTWRHDPHCDHAAAAALVDRAALRLGDIRVLAYPIWGWTLPAEIEIGAPPDGARLDIARHVAAKTRAIEAHRSQTTALIADDPDGFRLQPDMIARFTRPFEVFLREPREPQAATRHVRTLAADYFEDLYAADSDPWRFATSGYEAEKYIRTLASLPSTIYDRALEIGCSIGVLTHQLASHCVTLLALDAAEGALSQARERCRDRPGVSFRCAMVPADWPDGTYDLILLSEIVYYLDPDDVLRLVEQVQSATRDGADIVLVHWLGLTDYPLSGDEAADLFIRGASPFARVLHQRRTGSVPYRRFEGRAGIMAARTITHCHMIPAARHRPKHPQ